jgi:4-hydroxybenzoate polyprenyltransferase
MNSLNLQDDLYQTKVIFTDIFQLKSLWPLSSSDIWLSTRFHYIPLLLLRPRFTYSLHSGIILRLHHRIPLSRATMTRRNEKEEVPPQGKILNLFPPGIAPYAELMRIHRLLGFYLNTSPYLVGVAFSASISSTKIPIAVLLHRAMLLSIWSIFLRSAGCVWDDLIDMDLDSQISRTKSRPLPRGAVSPSNALLLTVALFACGGTVLIFLPWACTVDCLIITFFALSYPFGKRFTDYPQITLMNIGWAVPMAMHSLGLDPLSQVTPTVCMFLFIGSVIIMIDVIYSRQDTEEDLKVGVKSMAVRFRDSIQLLSYSLLCASTGFLAMAGVLTGLGLPFFVLSVGGHFCGFWVLLKATQVGKSSGVESYAKSAFFLATLFWLFGFMIEYCLRS